MFDSRKFLTKVLRRRALLDGSRTVDPFCSRSISIFLDLLACFAALPLMVELPGLALLASVASVPVGLSGSGVVRLSGASCPLSSVGCAWLPSL
jgi:hypothetical protein